MGKDYELLNAIRKVREDAEKMLKYHQAAMLKASIWGKGTEWEKAAYHQRDIEELEHVLHYLYIRSMQIDPD